jgi:hypothetical protein
MYLRSMYFVYKLHQNSYKILQNTHLSFKFNKFHAAKFLFPDVKTVHALCLKITFVRHLSATDNVSGFNTDNTQSFTQDVMT